MAYFHCLIGGGSSGGGYELTVTCDADFAGTTITATDGVTTLTKTCPSASPYEVEFEIPNGGDWTISGVYQGTTYSTQINIPDAVTLEATHVPEGATVTPTDDIQTWLACAEIEDKSYTTLLEVLADTDTYQLLLANSNACDYMVRSTTWASGISADATAMRLLGRYDYACDKLLSDSTWASAIGNSSYWEYVLDVKVPTMTSNTTPSGTCGGTSKSSDSNDYYMAFDNNTSTRWQSNTNGTGSRIYYQFTKATHITKLSLVIAYSTNINFCKTFSVQASNDGTNWTTLLSQQATANNENVQTFIFNNANSYTYYGIVVNSTDNTSGYCSIREIQFYGVQSNYEQGKVAIHGARNAQIYYLDGGQTENIGTTDSTTGVASVNVADIPTGSYAMYDTVAKDPTNLSNDYSKTVTITSNTTDVWLMPDNALYWWGYIDNNFADMYSNGYTVQYRTLATSTFNTNNVSMASNSNTSGVGTINTVDITNYNSLKAVCKYNKTSGNYAGFANVSSKAITDAMSKTGYTNNNTLTLYTRDISETTGAQYIMTFGDGQNTTTLSAMWYE